MPSQPLRVLLVDQPGWARDLVERALVEAELSVEAVEIDEVSGALGRALPDFVVLTEPIATAETDDTPTPPSPTTASSEAASPTLPLPPPSNVEALVASHLRPRLVRLLPSGTANLYDVRLSVGEHLGSLNPVEIADLVSSIGTS